MGKNLGGLLGTIISGIVKVFQALKGKPNWTDISLKIVPEIFNTVNYAIEFGGYNTKEKFDDFLLMLDAKTGVDPEAFDILKDVTPEAEEEFFDGIAQAVRAFGYAKLKVPGYFQGA